MRPHGTYSIAARDPDTGELGVAVQSHWFSVGSLCTWARPGVGAVATQSVVEPGHGPRGLDRLAAGEDASTALAALLAADELAPVRQVGIVDAHGGVAVHTGAGCIPEAGHVRGEHWVCQANMMERATVPDAMSAGFARSDGDLAERLMTALEARRGRGRRRPRPPVGRPARRARRRRAVAVPRRPARRGPRRPRRRAAPAARAPARVRARRGGGRADGRGALRRGGAALRAGRGAGSELGRAAVLGRARPRAERRRRGRSRRHPARGSRASGLAHPARPAVTRVRSGGRAVRSALRD